MKIRKATIDDLPIILNIISDAQKHLAALNIDQWQDGYPNESQIKNDIKNNESYIVFNETDIIGTFMFTMNGEETYNTINGKWLTDRNTKYGVVHRIAVFDKYRGTGFAKKVFEYCEKNILTKDCHSFRIDTHKDNKGMQNLLKKLNFTYCGIITLNSGDSRLAYEKIL